MWENMTAEPLGRNTVEQAKCYKSGTATLSLAKRLVVVGNIHVLMWTVDVVSMW